MRLGRVKVGLANGRVESTFFKEEADFVATAEEVIVAYMFCAFASRELGHRVVV